MPGCLDLEVTLVREDKFSHPFYNKICCVRCGYYHSKSSKSDSKSSCFSEMYSVFENGYLDLYSDKFILVLFLCIEVLMNRSVHRRTQENPLARYWGSWGNFTSVSFAVFYF